MRESEGEHELWGCGLYQQPWFVELVNNYESVESQSPLSITPQEYDIVKTFSDLPKKGVTALKFGPDAKTLFVGSADHNLRIIGLSGAMQQ